MRVLLNTFSHLLMIWRLAATSASTKAGSFAATWAALSRCFSLAYNQLTLSEKVKINRVIRLAGVACGEVTWSGSTEEVFK